MENAAPPLIRPPPCTAVGRSMICVSSEHLIPPQSQIIFTANVYPRPPHTFARRFWHSLALRPRNAKFHAKIKQQRWYRCPNQAQKAQKRISSCSFSTQRASSPQSTTFKPTGLVHGRCMTKIHIQNKNFSTTANIYAHLEYSSKVVSADAMLAGLGIENRE